MGETGRRNQFEIEFGSDHQARYAFLGKELPLDNPGGVLKVVGDGIELKLMPICLAATCGSLFHAENLAKSIRRK